MQWRALCILHSPDSCGAAEAFHPPHRDFLLRLCVFCFYVLFCRPRSISSWRLWASPSLILSSASVPMRRRYSVFSLHSFYYLGSARESISVIFFEVWSFLIPFSIPDNLPRGAVSVPQLPLRFNDNLVLRQLRYTGMLETVRIRQSGYNIKYSFKVTHTFSPWKLFSQNVVCLFLWNSDRLATTLKFLMTRLTHYWQN